MMIEQVLNRKNLYKAHRQVVQNKGAAGIAYMSVEELCRVAGRAPRDAHYLYPQSCLCTRSYPGGRDTER
ncbi:MAG: hypothetical protein AAF600_22520 [Bacteroidota bacterium]